MEAKKGPKAKQRQDSMDKWRLKPGSRPKWGGQPRVHRGPEKAMAKKGWDAQTCEFPWKSWRLRTGSVPGSGSAVPGGNSQRRSQQQLCPSPCSWAPAMPRVP